MKTNGGCDATEARSAEALLFGGRLVFHISDQKIHHQGHIPVPTAHLHVDESEECCLTVDRCRCVAALHL